MHMVRSAAKTVEEFLDELPEDRRTLISEMRKLIRKHLPKGYQESVNWGMLAYEVPLSTYPDTYNQQPICYAALASQKHYCALYLMGVYGSPERSQKLKDAFAAEGKKPDMGKSCIRFKSLSDLPLKTIGELIAGVPPEKMIAMHEAAHRRKR
jgi:hypothetical protein